MQTATGVLGNHLQNDVDDKVCIIGLPIVLNVVPALWAYVNDKRMFTKSDFYRSTLC